jgi:UDP-N-acetylmuramate dehydrogenase (EC 1.1.1.158)
MNAAAIAWRSRGELRVDAPLARLTSWRVGGPAACLFRPADQQDLLDFLAHLPPDEPLLWLGLGSNLLVRDGGFPGTVIALYGSLDTLTREDAVTLRVGAGLHCARLAKYAEREHLAGLGFMAGIPGTLGGALAMNAGAWGGETWSVVRDVEVALRGGHARWLPREAFATAYREVTLPPEVLGFLGARLSVAEDLDGAHAAATRAALTRRKATQPVGRPSAGSTFRNPPGDHAARLIERSGLKGLRVGGAEVSPLHANFIVTGPGASAADVEQLIEQIRERVHADSGIELQTEVRIVGVHADA